MTPREWTDEQFPALVKTERTRLNETQPGLAQILGVTSRTIINWEHGQHLPHYTTQLGVMQILRNIETKL